jgi:hypothetical protein
MILILIFLFLLLPTGAFAVPVYDNAASTSGDTIVELTITGFTTAGSDRLLTSCVRNNESAVTAHHYNASENMTSVLSATLSGIDIVTFYRLINPTVGAHDLVATFSTPVSGTLGAISFTGAHQTTPLGTAVKVEGVMQSSGATVSVSSAADELVVDCFAAGSVTPTEGAAQTERWDEVVVDFGVANGSTEAGAGSVVMNWSWSPDDFTQVGLIGVSVKPAAAPVSGSRRKAIFVE